MSDFQMGSFARTIAENKNYLHKTDGGNRETWPEASWRVAFNVVSPYLPNLTARIAKLIEERKFVPGGRYLYAAGRSYPQVNNCLAGDTRIITRQGVHRLDELVGRDFEVLNRHGEWERAESRCFGVQTLYRVVFSCGAEVVATADHRWWQRDGGRVTTDELESVPHATHAELPAVSAEGIRHGVVYGDGQYTCGGRYSCVFLCTEKKRELAHCFEDREVEVTVGGGAKLRFRTHREKKAGLFVGLQPSHYKTLPGDDGTHVSPSYARGFIAGLIATDGHVKGRFAYISCEGWAKAERIRELAVLGGCVVREVRIESTVSPFDGSPRELCLISITSGTAPVIRSDHREWLASRSRPRKTYKAPDTDELDSEVRSVEELGDDLVYCCVVPGSESFTLASGLLTSNCFLLRAADSRDGPQGWAETVSKATNALMTGGGIGVVYSDLRPEDAPILGLGGRSTGSLALMKMVNECARYVRQGGSRRSAVWAGLRWNHKDIFKFIKMKEWDEITLEGKRRDFNFPAPMDTTNISVILDDEFFEAYGDKDHPLYDLACDVYWEAIRHMLRTGEPGFSVDIGEHAGENLRNACLTGDTLVAVADGRGAVPIKDLVGTSTLVYASDGAGNVKVGTLRNVRVTKRQARLVRVTFDDGTYLRLTPDHLVMLANGSFVEAGKLRKGTRVMPFSSKVYQKYRRVRCSRRWDKQCNIVLGRKGCTRDGLDVHHSNGDCLDDRLENLELLPHGEHAAINMVGDQNPTRRIPNDFAWRVRKSKATTGLGNGRYVNGRGTKPRALAAYHDAELPPRGEEVECEWCGAHFVGRPGARSCSRRCGAKLGNKEKRRYQARSVVSVVEDGREDVYDGAVDGLHCFVVVTTKNPDLRAGEFGGVVVHNCTEVTSRDDCDMCNLGSINMARIGSVEEFAEVCELGCAFLTCGTLYSKLPVPAMYQVRERNRRIGLGLMGVHEWMLKRGQRYGPCDELARWMAAYTMSGAFAHRWADKLSISRPIATRSIAPTGTISIVAETTSGIEPIPAVAYKRRYLDGQTWRAQYVIDPTAKRLIDDRGVDPNLIEDSMTLAEDVERRVSFQSWLQGHVDHGISSTINLPPWGSSINNESTVTRFGNTLLKYLPKLRGITAYPDGARDGQPLTRVAYSEAVGKRNVVFEDGSERQCANGLCGA